MPCLDDLLQRWFGYYNFKSRVQRDAIDEIIKCRYNLHLPLTKHDMVLVFACFQVVVTYLLECQQGRVRVVEICYISTAEMAIRGTLTNIHAYKVKRTYKVKGYSIIIRVETNCT